MKFTWWGILLFSVFSLMSLAALIGGCNMLVDSYNFKNNSTTTKGIVIGAGDNTIGSGRSYHDGTIRTSGGFFPIIKYEVNGDSLTATSGTSAENHPIAIGDEVEVVYSNSDPTIMEVKMLVGSGMVGGIVCTVLGVLFSSILFLLGHRTIRMKKGEAGIL